MEGLTVDELEFLRTVDRFADRELKSQAAEDDVEQRLDVDLIVRLGELGVYGMRFPEAYGGSGSSMLAATAVLETLAKANTGFAASIIVHLAVGSVLLHVATEEQRAQYLTEVVSGTALCGMAITEPDAGSDVRSMRTRARRDGNEWVIDGEKIYITNGASAAFLIVAALVENTDRMAWFIVERDDPGFEVAGKLDKLGVRASETVVLRFDGCRVPAGRLLGDPESDGFLVAKEAMNQDRLLGATVAVGLAARALDEAVAYTATRVQFGRPVAEFQSVRHTIADLATQIEAGRSLVREAARLVDAGLPYATQAAMAKLFAGRLVREVCAEALELHGGAGFMNESTISRLYRDAPVMAIAGGTSNMQRELIGRAITAAARATATMSG
ncbi:MAG: acyl-CoA dehydrogenase family protein [Acidimicrobiales bacterium]|nr:acyl-CoA dehydrogenase family protein [Acidimicrobiales bacterium]